MSKREFKQSDYMALQLMEIESFRKFLSSQSDEKITFQEATMLWIAQGYADEFKSEYQARGSKIEPALA